MRDFDIERFITEVEARPAIWNSESPDYLNKYARHKAWEEVCYLFIEDYDTLGVAEKAEKSKNFQKKWRNLRDSFTRELNIQNHKSSSRTRRSDRKQYIFYNNLLFLRHTIEKRKSQSKFDDSASHSSNKTTSNTNDFEDDDLTAIEDDPDYPIVELVSPKEISKSKKTKKVDLRPLSLRSQKRVNEHLKATELKNPENISKRFVTDAGGTPQPQPSTSVPSEDQDRLLKVLENISKHFGLNAEGTPQPQQSTNVLNEDQDRLFLMSLLDDLKKVHDSNKLEMKSEIIMVIKKWQRTPPADNCKF